MIEEFKSLGFENYEAKALEVLLKGRLSVKELSKKTNIPFGKIYSIIKKLKERGFVSETNSRPKLVYVENASEIIDRLIKNKQEKDRQLNDRLREIANEVDKGHSKESKFFEVGITQEENKKIQLRSFSESKKEILQIINIHHKPKSNRKNKIMWEKEIEKAVLRGILFKSIYPRDAVLPPILEKLNKKHPEKFQVKRFDTDFIRCDIIDEEKILLKIVNEDFGRFGGILFFENEKFAKNLREIFNDIWEESV